MRIAQVAPLTEAIPPKLYGGTERVVHWLTEELVALGHDVTLFASGDSQTQSAKLEPCWPRALRLDGSVRDPNALHMAMLEQVRRRADEFDFLHFHLDYYPFSLFSRQPTPFVTTLHGRLDLPEHQPVFDTFSDVPVISISNSQRRPLPQANWVRTVHHGLPEKLLAPQPVTPSYFAFLGRIAPEKRVDRAIQIAEHCGIPLKIAAKIDRADRDYYDEEIQPLLDRARNVEYIGEIGDKDKVGVPQRRDRAAGSDRLAGAVRARDDRGDGLRHARSSPTTAAPCRKSSRTASPASSSRTRRAPSARSIASRISRGRRYASASSSALRRGAWRSTISPPIAA